MDKIEESIYKMYEALDELSYSPSDETLECFKKVEKEINILRNKWESAPKMISDPNLQNLKDACKEYIDSIKDNGRHMKDGEHWIFEAALEAIYGENVFDWVNKHDLG